jgi:hypothetical protein
MAKTPCGRTISPASLRLSAARFEGEFLGRCARADHAVDADSGGHFHSSFQLLERLSARRVGLGQAPDAAHADRFETEVGKEPPRGGHPVLADEILYVLGDQLDVANACLGVPLDRSPVAGRRRGRLVHAERHAPGFGGQSR